jgi:hypothetical protein
MMTPAPLFFVHGKRVVRGKLTKRRLANHKVEVQALNYVLPDGSDQPIALDFKRVLDHQQTTAEAGPLLDQVKPQKRKRSAK